MNVITSSVKSAFSGANDTKAPLSLLTPQSSVSNNAIDSEINTSLGMLFISGDRASVGKSTVCLGVLASLLYGSYTNEGTHKLLPQALAYINPVTQREDDTIVTKFCRSVGIDCVPVGPVVFYKGFTRAFLSDECEYSREQYLEQIIQKVKSLKLNKKLVVVDGVGYPSVGSICQLSNADVCSVLTHTSAQNITKRIPVLLVGVSMCSVHMMY
mgnify:CR=1 FL=1